jgi:hypothetical protein
MAPVLPLLPVISAVATAGGAVMSGIATGNAAAYQAQIAANNAKIANQNAAYASAAGHAKEEQQGMKGAAQMGAIKAEIAANGVDVNTGTAKDVETSAREEERLNTLNVANKSALEVYGYRAQQTQFEAEQKLYGNEAEEAPIGGFLSGAGDLFGGISGLGGGAAARAAGAAGGVTTPDQYLPGGNL